MKIIDYIMELFYPKRCIICREILPYGTDKFFCEECESKKDFADKLDFSMIVMESCEEECYFDKCSCVFYYDYVKKAIEHFKFKGFRNDCLPLAEEMYSYGVKNDVFENIDIITAVPIHDGRMKERGFNHAYLLAEILGARTNISAKDNILKRVRQTKPQYLLSVEERRENIKDAFIAENVESFKDKRVLIIDDIFTTGGTVNECAKVLKNSGAAQVDVFELSCSSANKSR